MDEIGATMTPRFNSTIAPEDAARSEELYYVLATNLKNPSAALKKIQSVKEGEGFEAWRQFLLEYEPLDHGRFGATLDGILARRYVDPLLQSLESSEMMIMTYESQSGEKVTETI